MMMLSREQARQEIRANWRKIIVRYTDKAKQKMGGKDTYICPFCGHGQNGDGIKDNPKSKDGNGIKCFGACGFSGDILAFIEKKTGADYNTALKEAAEILGIEIEPYRASAAADFNDRAQAPQTPREAAAEEKPAQEQKSPQEAAEPAPAADYTDYYQVCMMRLDDPAALSYLQARKISIETAECYNVGYDPKADPANFPGATEDTAKFYPGPRLIIPVTKDYYIARSIKADIPAGKKSMYPKGSTWKLFNVREILEPGPVFVTEGIFDALSVIEVGARAVSLNGASNASKFINLLEDLQRDIKCSFIICPDNDAAGKGSAEKLREGLNKIGSIKYIFANIAGNHKDANDALKADRDLFIQAVKEAQERAEKIPMSEGSADYLTEFFEKISGESYRPYTTGIKFFDDLLSGGPIRQTLLLLLAAPAAGKTTLMQQVSESIARHGRPVLYLNLEMSREQMLSKSISARATFKGHPMTTLDIMQGYRWTGEQRQIVQEIINEYRETIAPYMDYNPDGITGDLDTIRGYLNKIGEATETRRRLLREAGQDAKAAQVEAPAVVLDYLHLVSCKGEDSQEVIKIAMDALKQYAIKYNTVAVAIAATNRESMKDGRITINSGRDSSGIEYGADYILSLNYYQIDKGIVKPSDIEKVSILNARAWRQMIIRVLKGRLCFTGWPAKVYFHSAGNRFYAEDDFLPEDQNIIHFGDQDPELDNAGLVAGNFDLNNLVLPEAKTPKAGRRR